MPDDQRSWRRAESWIAGAVVAVALATVYVVSPLHPLYDARFALLTSESLLTRGSWNLVPLLHEEVVADVRRSDEDDPRFQRHLWQLEPLPDGRMIYRYPPGTSIFSLPFVAAARVVGASTLGEDGRYSRRHETQLQTILAALVTAATALVIHRLALRELPLGPASAVALVAGLGSALWSSASQSLWPHTWTALWVALALLELLRWEDGERRRPIVLALSVSAAFWARPTAALVALPVALFVLWRHRRATWRLVLAGAAAAAAYAALTLIVWSSYLPSYARVLEQGGSRRTPWDELYRILFSQRSGLLVYSPILVAVVLALAVHGIGRERRPFAYLNFAILVAHLALYSRWGIQRGTLGQRLFAELVPCFAWLAAHAWRRAREAARARPPSPARRLAVRLAVALLVLASVAAQATGVVEMHWKNLHARMRAERLLEARGGPPARLKPVRPGKELPQWTMAKWIVTEWLPGPPDRAGR